MNNPAGNADLICLQRIAAGDEQALRNLYNRHGQRLYAYALRLTGCADLANEAVQESLLAIWQGAGAFRGDAAVSTWMLGIVHHKAVDLLRRKPQQVSLREEMPACADENEPFSALERRELIRRYLQKLPSDQQAVLDLVFYQGKTLAEAAIIMNCPLGTVKSRLNQAKTNLRGLLKRAGMETEE
ncbi:MAG: sigma-70 family RNA polymerase sigma factor [Anaerolineae bacterium]|nr:sigma-70 family RNA polymerase sigma factor [Anaerolineae bacterium]